MLSKRWVKDLVRTAENCQILHAKFHVHFMNIQRKMATKVSFHSCDFTCTGKFYLSQAYPKIP